MTELSARLLRIKDGREEIPKTARRTRAMRLQPGSELHFRAKQVAAWFGVIHDTIYIWFDRGDLSGYTLPTRGGKKVIRFISESSIRRRARSLGYSSIIATLDTMKEGDQEDQEGQQDQEQQEDQHQEEDQ